MYAGAYFEPVKRFNDSDDVLEPGRFDESMSERVWLSEDSI